MVNKEDIKMQNTKKVFSINDVKNKKSNVSLIQFPEVKYLKDGGTVPIKTMANLEYLLNYYGINPVMNKITHELTLQMEGRKFKKRGEMLTFVYDLQVKEGLNLNRAVCDEYLIDIANRKEINPFVDMLKKYRNDNHDIVLDVFEKCLTLQDDALEDAEYYFTLFYKWLLNVVKMAHNELENRYSSNGVLTLQGEQGCRKSTFARKLMPLNDLFKDGVSLDPDKTDSVIQNTKYILVELAELDTTLKADQGKIKQFLTNTTDEYRVPFGRVAEIYPRLTSYIANVNKKDFLKDETGSRRFWVIPVKSCNIEEFDNFNMFEFWGAVYDMWLTNYSIDWLTKEEEAKQKIINRQFNAQTDISIILDDKVDWESNDLKVYKLTEIAEKLNIKEKKALANELMRRGIPNQPYKVDGKSIRGYKIPFIRDYWE